ncbi:MAG: hypothetical protein JXJ04_24500 [Spirochaetales bacterium]|nr:hypothetical protein [Spirochaetales bacterium]
MEKNEKDSNTKTRLTRIVLGAFTALFYGIFFFMDSLHLNIDAGIPLFAMWGIYIPAVVLTGFRAKQLGRSAGGWAVGSFFTGLIPSIVLLFLGKKKTVLIAETIQKQVKEADSRKVERAILAFAKENKGYVSVSNAALEAGITMEEAQKVMDELVKKGFAQLEVKSSGILMYVFQDFLEDD